MFLRIQGRTRLRTQMQISKSIRILLSTVTFDNGISSQRGLALR